METIESIKKRVESQIKSTREIYSNDQERLKNISHIEQNIDEYVRGLIARESIQLVKDIEKFGKYDYRKDNIQRLLKERRVSGGNYLGIEPDDQILDIISNTSKGIEAIDIKRDRIAQAIYESFGYTDKLVSERELKTAEENCRQSYNPETLYAFQMAKHSRGIDVTNNVSNSFRTATDYQQRFEQLKIEEEKKEAEKQQFSEMYEQAAKENEEFDRKKEEEKKEAERQAAFDRYKKLKEEYDRKSIFGKMFAKLTGKTTELETAKNEYFEKYANVDVNEGRSR